MIRPASLFGPSACLHDCGQGDYCTCVATAGSAPDEIADPSLRIDWWVEAAYALFALGVGVMGISLAFIWGVLSAHLSTL